MYLDRSLLRVLVLAGLGPVLLAGPSCAGEPVPAPVPRGAQTASSIDLVACLDAVQSGTRPDETRCPGFLTDALTEAAEVCREAGGTLRPAAEPVLWSLDVEGDGRMEYLFALDGSVGCDGAWSVFGCGSLGCPKILYRNSGATWSAIGAIGAEAPDAVEVLASPGGNGPGELRVGCAFEDPCDEIAYFEWTGQAYEAARLDVRGFRVDVADSEHGLWGLTGAIDVRATPAADGAVLAHYGSDTEVVILGRAADRPWYYVSPCNACQSGFIEVTAIRPR